jgi:transcriptional regulator with XRE-family HTH domain
MARDQRNGTGGSEIGRFLRAHRARVTPEQAGLPVGTGVRRTPGLRREELATLAGVSIDYYTRLERGKETNPSPAVVDALALALRLDPQESRHLRELVACAARSTSEPCATSGRSVSPGVRLLLESLRPNPAYVISRTMDILVSNEGGARLFAGLEEWPAEKRNVVRYLFLHPDAPKLFDDWEEQARACIGRLRALAGTDPDAPELAELVAELLHKSPAFTGLWDQYDVRLHTHGDKTFHHPQVGDIVLGYQSMQLEGTPGHRLSAYYAEPGTPDYDKMLLLDAAAPDRDQLNAG